MCVLSVWQRSPGSSVPARVRPFTSGQLHGGRHRRSVSHLPIRQPGESHTDFLTQHVCVTYCQYFVVFSAETVLKSEFTCSCVFSVCSTTKETPNRVWTLSYLTLLHTHTKARRVWYDVTASWGLTGLIVETSTQRQKGKKKKEWQMVLRWSSTQTRRHWLWTLSKSLTHGSRHEVSVVPLHVFLTV